MRSREIFYTCRKITRNLLLRAAAGKGRFRKLIRSLGDPAAAGRSRGSRKLGTRDYSVRVTHSGGIAELIEYGQGGYGDFELRSGDLVAFSYVGANLILSQNLTIGRYSVNAST